MPGGGTTGGGAFRFPYQIDTLVQDIPALEEISHLLMDRDRALEDYLTDARNSVFIVVADDGSVTWYEIAAPRKSSKRVA